MISLPVQNRSELEIKEERKEQMTGKVLKSKLLKVLEQREE